MFFCQILWRRILFESLAQLWKFGGQLPYVFLSCADQDFSLFSNRISLQLFPIFLISNSPAMSFVFISCHLLSTNEYQKYKSVELGDQLDIGLPCSSFQVDHSVQTPSIKQFNIISHNESKHEIFKFELEIYIVILD